MTPLRLATFALVMLTPTVTADDRATRATAWEPEFKTVEARRKREAVAIDAPVFLGSSSFRLWDTAKDLPDIKPFNAGFGGSQIRDTTQSLDRILGDARPKYAAIYAGDNDIAAGRTPEMVRDDTIELITKLRAKFPNLPVMIVPIKPSPSRIKQLPAQEKANKMVRDYCARHSGLLYLEIAPEMMNDKGAPKRELFKADMLHLNAKGYAIWAKLMRAALKTWPAAG